MRSVNFRQYALYLKTVILHRKYTVENPGNKLPGLVLLKIQVDFFFYGDSAF